MGYAAVITLLPLLVVGFAARAIWKLSYPSLCGLLSGSMTDPPALAFAGQLNNSETPSLSYATVYPLTMLLRVVSAQIIVLLFAGGGGA
jgi:putative transport protein